MNLLSFSSFDIFSLLLNLTAFGLFARGLVAISCGNPFPRKFLTVLLIAIALVLRLVLGYTGPLSTLALTLRDAGIGMVLTGLVARMFGGKGMILFVPGFLGLLMALGLTGAVAGFNGLKDIFAKGVSFSALNSVNTPNSATKRLLVELGEDDRLDEIQSLLNQFEAQAERAFPTVSLKQDADLAQYYIVTLPQSNEKNFLEAVRADRENVDSAEPDSRVEVVPVIPSTLFGTDKRFSGTVNDPEASKQWALDASGLTEAFQLIQKISPRKKAKVAILDTGIDDNHEDLTAVTDHASAVGDKQGHGTHCAGIAGAATNNGLGIASPNFEGKFIEILSFKALGENGSGSNETVAQAIIDAVDAGADVLSLSLGGYAPVPPKVHTDAVEYALKKGCIIVVAAGNDNEDAQSHSPANVPGVITVAATEVSGAKSDFSNTTASLKLPIAAPGTDIHSLKTGGGYVAYSGTSMATPLVAGIAGLLKSVRPDLTQEEFYQIIHSTGKTLPDSDRIGKLIQAQEALKALKSL